ncbi:hypothetical protein P691DRAFT_783334 [Macrolepiota fuliginosa MF-IS2]|uniref:Glutaredoxin domain-containing protein n=1 Tax=Macrolepiota fuliginosa MF-IS2 TaxID=1400762 RepID=A0A9P5XL05_9AGAR|nr:hypothetical protein P691DRAFT_783334 [Macrolepiota fuliginosa MF-IS2]
MKRLNREIQESLFERWQHFRGSTTWVAICLEVEMLRETQDLAIMMHNMDAVIAKIDSAVSGDFLEVHMVMRHEQRGENKDEHSGYTYCHSGPLDHWKDPKCPNTGSMKGLDDYSMDGICLVVDGKKSEAKRSCPDSVNRFNLNYLPPLPPRSLLTSPSLMFIPRVTSRTALQEHLLPFHTSSEKPQPPLFMAQLAAALHPRKSKQRTAILALIFLVLLSAYVLLVHCASAGASLALRRPETRPGPSQLALALDSIRNSRLAGVHSVETAKQIQLTSAEELAAVSSFLASLPQNQIPSSVDPSSPIDPQLVLDFDTRGPRASEEVRAMVDDVWSRNPVFLYSKFYSPSSREVKAILAGLNLKPSPTIIDVDVRDDADVLIPVLRRLTSSDEFPFLIIAGKPVGSVQEIRRMVSNGTLRQMITRSGAVIDGVKKKKH